MDADCEFKTTRYSRRVRQLILIPDADVSDAENKSDSPCSGASSAQDSSDDWSDDELPLSRVKDSVIDDDDNDDDDVPLAQMQRDTGLLKTDKEKAVRKVGNFRWRDMRQPIVNTTWKDRLPDPPQLTALSVTFANFYQWNDAEDSYRDKQVGPTQSRVDQLSEPVLKP